MYDLSNSLEYLPCTQWRTTNHAFEFSTAAEEEEEKMCLNNKTNDFVVTQQRQLTKKFIIFNHRIITASHV